MNIVLIGTGNTSHILGRKLKQAGHNIIQVFGRDAATASQLAYDLDTESTNYWSVVTKEADIYLVAVSDDAINEVAKHLHVPGKIVAHTAGSVNHDVLKTSSIHHGVFYPLQSLHKDVDHLPALSILIDASDQHTKKILEELAGSISDRAVMINDHDRMKLHVAAVVCNNFTNYLYALAEDFCRKEKLDFALLYPLIQETAERALLVSPGKSQTGPAVRGDVETIKEHVEILDAHPELKKVYDFLSRSIGTHSF